MFARATLSILIFCVHAFAQAGPATAFTVGVENLQYYPLHTVRNGEYAGYARELLDAFAAQKSYTFKYVPLPIDSLFTSFLRERALDFKYPDNPKWQTELKTGVKLFYSVPLVVSQEGAMVVPANRGRDVKQIKKLGTVKGFTPWPYSDAIKENGLLVVTSGSFEGLLRDAMVNRVDAVYINVDVANYMLREILKAQGKLVFDPALPYARSDFSISTIRHANVIDEFNAFLLQEHALVQKLRAKYGIEGR